jgi:hypothetical protein
MRADDDEERKPLQRLWTDVLGRWLRQPMPGDETEEPTTAASQTMRERLDEPRD